MWKLHDILPNKIYLVDQIEDEEIRGQGGEKCLKYYVGERRRKSRLGRLRCRWENIIRMDLKDVEWKDTD